MVEELGADAFIYGTSGVEGRKQHRGSRARSDDHDKGSTIKVSTDSAAVHLFDTATGIRLHA